MNKWTPITHEELIVEIQKTETDLSKELNDFWQRIKINPEKWEEDSYEKKR